MCILKKMTQTSKVLGTSAAWSDAWSWSELEVGSFETPKPFGSTGFQLPGSSRRIPCEPQKWLVDMGV